MAQNAWTLTYSDVMGLCRLAYTGKGIKGTTYLVANREWTVVDVFERGSYRSIVSEGKDLNNVTKRILSFSGSDDGGDWGMGGNAGVAIKGSQNTEQYILGLQKAREIRPDFYTGHSLGGGIALYCCVMTNVKTATINPSPLFNDVFGMQFEKFNKTAPAINYCVNYEILAAGRNIAGLGIPFLFSVGATPGKRVTVGSSGKDPYHRHLLPNLEGFIEPKPK